MIARSHIERGVEDEKEEGEREYQRAGADLGLQMTHTIGGDHTIQRDHVDWCVESLPCTVNRDILSRTCWGGGNVENMMKELRGGLRNVKCVDDECIQEAGHCQPGSPALRPKALGLQSIRPRTFLQSELPIDLPLPQSPSSIA